MSFPRPLLLAGLLASAWAAAGLAPMRSWQDALSAAPLEAVTP